jgi:hypothetical protein
MRVEHHLGTGQSRSYNASCSSKYAWPPYHSISLRWQCGQMSVINVRTAADSGGTLSPFQRE